MIYKVYYQESKNEVPVREKTKSMYFETNNERTVRQMLKDQKINIEYIQLLEGEYLEYEKQSEHFKLQENVSL
ncbi:DNA-dependent RNA polymerase auxiliary subunit epsilon family protein [Bacillus sp. FJAT-49732]|uniref:DNA-directed RNA polymerase subunit epsilon n=1 Tax=Lederbergia citrisecunda TaxID=2833583 RepID=A0A942YK38_9BACI|nr:DNA-directed RNA polymerase subunit epsilon [Lederbergia citrisecunda]MBS4198799.1 DNA-dependent RNA polymerase auxiliary subunit epsilon family protein [Lederbergia citrisecunda]